MRLSDVMAAAGLSGWAQVALLLFFAAFVTIALYTFARRNRERYERARFLPLEDDPVRPGEPAGQGGPR